MTKNKSWTNQDMHNFFTLVNHAKASLVIKPNGALSRLVFQNDIKIIEEIIGDTSKLGDAEGARYKNYLANVKKTPFGKWLHKNADFNQAIRLFQRKQQSKKNVQYHIEWAELRFLQCAAIVGLFVNYKDSENRPPSPTSREVDQAIARTKSLQKSLALGVRFNEYEKTAQLKTLLTELLETLKSAGRKPRQDKTTVERRFVALISSQFLENFGEVSPEIVIHLASAMGYAAHETTIQAQIRVARRKYQDTKRAAVVDEMVKAQKKTA